MLVFLLLFFLHFILRRISNVGTLQLRDAHCSKVISAVCQAPGNQLAALLCDNISSKRMYDSQDRSEFRPAPARILQSPE